MQSAAKRPLRQVLIVDSGLTGNAGAAVRSVRALASELRNRGIEVIEAHSCEDGIATATSDAGIDCILINWTQGANDSQSEPSAQRSRAAHRAREVPTRHREREAEDGPIFRANHHRADNQNL